MSRPIAVITGASSGIGAELARVYATEGYDLVLTARREDRLEALKDELSEATKGACVTHVVAADLARRRGVAKLVETIDELDLEVDVLVNNAGVAESGRFADMARGSASAMINLNVRALTELSLIFAQRMAERGHGRVLNVSSIVAFQPVPSMAVYSASKAYVLSLTESLSEEFRGTGVTFSALCPGLTRTEMAEAVAPAGFEPVADFVMSEARDVARQAFRACKRGEVIIIPGLLNQAFVNWSQTQPRWSYRLMSGLAARMSFAMDSSDR
ncbi:MAG: SDR family oxidoreductase [Pseudomonadota bacterium]